MRIRFVAEEPPGHGEQPATVLPHELLKRLVLAATQSCEEVRFVAISVRLGSLGCRSSTHFSA